MEISMLCRDYNFLCLLYPLLMQCEMLIKHGNQQPLCHRTQTMVRDTDFFCMHTGNNDIMNNCGMTMGVA